MAGSFRRMWGRRDITRGPGLRDKIRMLVRGGSIRERLVEARKKLDRDIRYLEMELSRFRALKENIAARLKKAIANGDRAIAGVLSNEIVNLRKIIHIMDKIRASFEKISMRIGLMLRVGDVATSISEVRPMIKTIIPLVAKMVPNFLDDVLQVDEVLDDLMSGTEMDIGGMLPTEPMSEEARQIMKAAELAVRHEEELGLPEEPSPAVVSRAKKVGGAF